ncbi:MAG: hypothetical protein IJY47_04055 [Clostridia bacterium]|nr:hypothetical protein [Clostridia bacterium]
MDIEQADYPFGFGFAFMKNREALTRFFAKSEEERHRLVRRLTELQTPQEREAWIEELSREP